MRTAHRRMLVLCLLALVLLGTTVGCTQTRVRSMSESVNEGASQRFAELDPDERQRLEEFLEGEIQTVYTSDTGLARVYGQVANLGEESFDAVQFELVAELKASARSDEQTLVESSTFSESVGDFVVERLGPGDIETFDVQTSVRPGDTKVLRVRVKGVR